MDDPVLAAHEACADLCDALAQKFLEEGEAYMYEGARECAEAIRDRIAPFLRRDDGKV